MSRKDPRPEPLTIGSSSGHRYRASSVPEAVYFDQLRLLGEESQNRHDYSGASTAAANYLHGQGMRRKGKSSWKDILKLKRKRAKLRSPPQLTDKVATETDVYYPRIGGYCIRVVVTEINPQAYYKTLEVTDRTTAFEVIVKLIQKYAVKEEDRDPNEFYLMEVKETTQGSYSRVLANTDQLYELQSRWAEEEDCYFALYRAQLPPTVEPEVEDKFEQPDISNFGAMIISPSQDSFFDSFPDPRDSSLPSFSPLPLPTSTHSMNTAPTNPTLPSYRDLSSRVQVSKLIMSPSESSHGQKDEPGNENKTHQSFSFSPSISTTKYSTFSDPRIETIAESEAENESSETRKLSNSSHLRYTQRKVMQKSLSMGMHGIMAKVVSETKQNSPVRPKAHERSQSSPSRLLTVKGSHLPPSPTSPQDLTIRNLACSPLAPAQVNRTKNIPDFVFTPGPDDTTSDSSEADFQGSESSEPMRSGGSLEKSFNIAGMLDFDNCTNDSFEGKVEDDDLGQWVEWAKSDRERKSLTDEQRSDIVGGLLDIAEEEGENDDDGEDDNREDDDDDDKILRYEEVEEADQEVADVGDVSAESEVIKEYNTEIGKGEDDSTEDEEFREEEEEEDGGDSCEKSEAYRSDTEEDEEANSEDSESGNGEDSEEDGIKSDEDSNEDEFRKIGQKNCNHYNLGDVEGDCITAHQEDKKENEKFIGSSHNFVSFIKPQRSPSELTSAPVTSIKTDTPSISTSTSQKANGGTEDNLIPVKHSSTSEISQDIKPTSPLTQLRTTRSEFSFEMAVLGQNKHTNDTVHSEQKSKESIKHVESSAPVHIPLRRAHTSQGLFSSVTRVNRPHSVHYGTSNPQNVAVDFTKDEIIRKAALHGMFKKPSKLKESTSSVANVKEKDREVSFPVKDIVTDLDNVAIGDQNHSKLIRRNSLFDMKSSGSDHQYVRIKDKMALLDGSPPRPLRQRERPKSTNFEQGSLRPFSAPSKFKKLQEMESK